MAKKKYIKAEWNAPRLPLTGTIVAYLLYKQLNLHGAWAGAYIAIVGLLLLLGWISVIYQIVAYESVDPKIDE